MKRRSHLLRSARVALVLLCAGCNDHKHLADQAKRATTAEQWQAWAAEVPAHSKTNSAPMPRSEWPAFIQRISAPLYRLATRHRPERLFLKHLASLVR
jgi:hypothetical protein